MLETEPTNYSAQHKSYTFNKKTYKKQKKLILKKIKEMQKRPVEKKESTAGYFEELRNIELLHELYRSKKLLDLAKKHDLPIPYNDIHISRIDDLEFKTSGVNWEYINNWNLSYLSTNGRHEIKKEYRKLIGIWFQMVSLVIGLIGALTGLIAVILN